MEALHMKIAIDFLIKSTLSEDDYYNQYSCSWLHSIRAFARKTWPSKTQKQYTQSARQ